mmetsp:Transcript_25317/g.58827  ORF Transcript_25317/g.58827 Transcript_25317/m.58827 type:complete len:385 (-) Transcript_25317:70-1224(-)
MASRIYVGGLDGSISEFDLRTHFEKFGELTDVYIPHDYYTGQMKHFGFVTFATEATAKEVMAASPHQIKSVMVNLKSGLPKGEGKGGKSGKAGADAGAVDATSQLASLGAAAGLTADLTSTQSLGIAGLGLGGLLGQTSMLSQLPLTQWSLGLGAANPLATAGLSAMLPGATAGLAGLTGFDALSASQTGTSVFGLPQATATADATGGAAIDASSLGQAAALTQSSSTATDGLLQNGQQQLQSGSDQASTGGYAVSSGYGGTSTAGCGQTGGYDSTAGGSGYDSSAGYGNSGSYGKSTGYGNSAGYGGATDYGSNSGYGSGTAGCGGGNSDYGSGYGGSGYGSGKGYGSSSYGDGYSQKGGSGTYGQQQQFGGNNMASSRYSPY